ncbi:MAG TPA: hypothetical protein VFG22_19270 [Polyangiales bacterium]|nr:hypothetical protein [Polyangiales bacterium]
MLLRSSLVFACVLALAARSARAAQYEVFIDVQTEEDLYDLLVTGQISKSSFEALLLLYQTRVDLNRAGRPQLYLLPNLDYDQVDRILAYRREAGSIHQLEDLVESGALEPELVRALGSFVIVRPADAPRSRVDGVLRIQALWSGRNDRLPPAMALQARVKAARNLDAGMAATLTRNGLGRVRWDRTRGALSAQPERARITAPKLYVAWSDARWEVIAGTYRIGFGQRLTFDVTDQITPNGFIGDYGLRRGGELELRCKRAAGELYESPCSRERVQRVTPDFDWSNRLSGIALGLRDQAIGKGWLQAYAWGSYQVHRAPQIELADRNLCDDPARDADPACRAPVVYVRGADPSAPSSTATFASLPVMYAEGLAGMNLTYFWSDRAQLGLTGYGSVPRWLIDGAELGFQEFARKPFVGAFGALGLNGSFGFGAQDFFVELARSFDALRGSGGLGAIARSVSTLPGAEIEVSARYYEPSYANPYARPISAPDELDGLRARDEAGLRIRVTAVRGRRFGLRTAADGWRRLTSGAFGSVLFARADLQLASAWTLALWAEHRNTGVQRFLLATKLAYTRGRRVSVSAQLEHAWSQIRLAAGGAQQDIAAVLSLTTQPHELLRLRLRVRYDFEDIWNNHRLPQAVWGYLNAALTLRERGLLRIRYDLRAFLDERGSTSARAPNPEHWIWLEYAFRY